MTLFNSPPSPDSESSAAGLRSGSDSVRDKNSGSRSDSGSGSGKSGPTRAQRLRSIGIMSLIGSLVIALALATVPTAYVIEEPGPVYDTLGMSGPDNNVPMISISGAETYPTTGQLDMLTVSVRGNPDSLPTWIEVASAWFDPSKAVVPVDAVYPPEETIDQRNAESAALMVNSQQDAIAAALTNLGYDVVRGVKVEDFTDESPAKGILEKGDVITRANGTRVTSVQKLRDILAESGAGNPATLTLIRAETETTVTVIPVEKDGAVVLGVGASVAYDFPFEVTIKLDDVGGPSAGMMFALGIIDKLTPGDLSGGMHIAGTGTIDANGLVGPIGGIRQKMFGARDAGATIFLAPAEDCGEVVGHVPDGLTVFSVKTLNDAKKALAFVDQNKDQSGAVNAHTHAIPTCEND